MPQFGQCFGKDRGSSEADIITDSNTGLAEDYVITESSGIANGLMDEAVQEVNLTTSNLKCKKCDYKFRYKP